MKAKKTNCKMMEGYFPNSNIPHYLFVAGDDCYSITRTDTTRKLCDSAQAFLPVWKSGWHAELRPESYEAWKQNEWLADHVTIWESRL